MLSCSCKLFLGWDVYRTTLSGQDGLAETFAQGGVRVDGLGDLFGGQFAVHGD